MTKLTILRLRFPVVAAMAIALVSSAQVTQAAVDSRITTVAKQAANEATIENVAQVGKTFGALIGDGSIKLTTANVTALGQVLADEIQAKLPNDFENRLTNKGDEIGESAAQVAAEIAVNAKFKKAGKAAILGLLKGSLKTAKKNSGLLQNAAPNLFTDVAGSVMLSLVNSTATDAKLDKVIYKFLSVNAAKVAGGKNAKVVKTGLKEAFTNATLANVKYEDGTLSVVIDPETDTRNA